MNRKPNAKVGTGSGGVKACDIEVPETLGTAIEQFRRNLHQSRPIRPQKRRPDTTTRINLGQRQPVSGQLIQISIGDKSDLGRRRPIRFVIYDQNVIFRYSEPVDLPGKIKCRALASGARDDGCNRDLCNAVRPKQSGEARLGQDRQSFANNPGARFRAQRLAALVD